MVVKKMVTKSSLIEKLKEAGVRSGEALFVHSSLSKLGWVCGGAQTVIEAIQEVVGPSGLIIDRKSVV